MFPTNLQTQLNAALTPLQDVMGRPCSPVKGRQGGSWGCSGELDSPKQLDSLAHPSQRAALGLVNTSIPF